MCKKEQVPARAIFVQAAGFFVTHNTQHPA